MNELFDEFEQSLNVRNKYGENRPSWRLAHQALSVKMRPSSALHDRRRRLEASLDAVTRTKGGNVITLLHATCTRGHLSTGWVDKYDAVT